MSCTTGGVTQALSCTAGGHSGVEQVIKFLYPSYNSYDYKVKVQTDCMESSRPLIIAMIEEMRNLLMKEL